MSVPPGLTPHSRRAPVEPRVPQGEDVAGAFVARRAQEGAVGAEGQAGGDTHPRTPSGVGGHPKTWSGVSEHSDPPTAPQCHQQSGAGSVSWSSSTRQRGNPEIGRGGGSTPNSGWAGSPKPSDPPPVPPGAPSPTSTLSVPWLSSSRGTPGGSHSQQLPPWHQSRPSPSPSLPVPPVAPVERGGVGAAAQLQEPGAALGAEEADQGPPARGRGHQGPRGAQGGTADLALVGVDGHRRRGRARLGRAQVLRGTGLRDPQCSPVSPVLPSFTAAPSPLPPTPLHSCPAPPVLPSIPRPLQPPPSDPQSPSLPFPAPSSPSQYPQ